MIMSLSKVLTQSMQPVLPVSVLAACPAADRTAFENILYCVQQFIPVCDLLRASTVKRGENYEVTVPMCSGATQVSLEHLRNIQQYSPARVLEIIVGFPENGERHLRLLLGGENGLLVVSEMDIVRIRKRSRWQ